MLIFGHCFRACALTSAFMVIGSSFFHQAQAQTLPDQLIADYGNCVGIELGDVDGRPIFFFDGSLQALPAPSEIELQGGIAAGNCQPLFLEVGLPSDEQ